MEGGGSGFGSGEGGVGGVECGRFGLEAVVEDVVLALGVEKRVFAPYGVDELCVVLAVGLEEAAAEGDVDLFDVALYLHPFVGLGDVVGHFRAVAVEDAVGEIGRKEGIFIVGVVGSPRARVVEAYCRACGGEEVVVGQCAVVKAV